MDPALRQQIIVSLVDKAGFGLLLLFAAFILNWSIERIRFRHGLTAERQKLALANRIAFKERQLSEFYGPIYGSLKQIRPIDDLWNTGRLKGEIEKSIVKRIRAANDRIVQVLLDKSHLLEGSTMPDSYVRFLAHVAVWHSFWEAQESEWLDWAELAEAHYDRDFEIDIFQTTERLRSELTELRMELGESY